MQPSRGVNGSSQSERTGCAISHLVPAPVLSVSSAIWKFSSNGVFRGTKNQLPLSAGPSTLGSARRRQIRPSQFHARLPLDACQSSLGRCRGEGVGGIARFINDAIHRVRNIIIGMADAILIEVLRNRQSAFFAQLLVERTFHAITQHRFPPAPPTTPQYRSHRYTNAQKPARTRAAHLLTPSVLPIPAPTHSNLAPQT